MATIRTVTTRTRPRSARARKAPARRPGGALPRPLRTAGWVAGLLGVVLALSGVLGPPASAAPQEPRGQGEEEPERVPLVEAGTLAGGSLADAGEVEADRGAEPPVLLGEVTRDEVETAVPGWVQAEIEADLDPEAVQELSMVEPGAEVTVFLGTWCSDSKRELSRLWRAFDEMAGLVPFEVSYVAVGRDKAEPEEWIEGSGLEYVPTFIVRRGGEEVGRIVEEAPHGIVEDLEALLSGEAAGVVSARDDLTGGDTAPGETGGETEDEAEEAGPGAGEGS